MTTDNNACFGCAASQAIEFALSPECEDKLSFLRCWYEADFDAIRNEWPEAPEGVFVGADPLHVPSQEYLNKHGGDSEGESSK
ncbi:hypothetical protein FWP33_07540 [Vibrio parahaemolyticus]|jgi:hypothetical protein|uniref:Uncharacterized protein n=2 Tax=Vibrio harveyi group TaxID=717610 RepID=A0A9Q3UBZ3_VIBPH|nr:hypothetical protein [Vibrio parahaemolyticus]ELA8176606.1 hypothetical protein [Vibrio alginolyticus]CAH1598481.1 hypothetical protein THF1C08_50129 [Vibrio jasicida]EGQ9742372.1 hypothetical protein [Vibrio parahaemolyticus]EJC7176038.1 hypothetical protein [Vibrio parahaemolyticus]EJE4724476.1 hypothetical protein [Vibrio parahaemolyticus]